MNGTNLTGYYSYRSFLNNPTGEPNDILFGAGELLIFINDEGSVNGTLSFPMESLSTYKEVMDIEGKVISNNPFQIHFIGKGRKNSSIQDFEYEYDCFLNHEWESSEPKQIVTFIGTVKRNKDHGNSKAGVTASFIAIKRSFTEPREIPGVALIPEALNMLGDRKHRLIHNVWHTARAMWNDLLQDEKDELKKLNWYFEDPPHNTDNTLNLSNGAGEDFLYMHRRMIKMINDIYDKKGLKRPESWKELPNPLVPQFFYDEVENPSDATKVTYKFNASKSGQMIPPPDEIFMEQVGGNSFLYTNKTPRGFRNNMLPIANNLRNRRVVGQLSLAAYGNLIEFTVHNWMHMRWANVSFNPLTNKPEVRNSFDIDSKWDDLKYDYLGDFHSSHVNPIFWKLHGWVDDCVEFWFETQEKVRSGVVKRKNVRGIDWFEKGDWVIKDNPFDWPNAEHHDHGHHHGHEIKDLEKAMSILENADRRIQQASVSISAFSMKSEVNLPSLLRFSMNLE